MWRWWKAPGLAWQGWALARSSVELCREGTKLVTDAGTEIHAPRLDLPQQPVAASGTAPLPGVVVGSTNTPGHRERSWTPCAPSHRHLAPPGHAAIRLRGERRVEPVNAASSARHHQPEGTRRQRADRRASDLGGSDTCLSHDSVGTESAVHGCLEAAARFRARRQVDDRNADRVNAVSTVDTFASFVFGAFAGGQATRWRSAGSALGFSRSRPRISVPRPSPAAYRCRKADPDRVRALRLGPDLA